MNRRRHTFLPGPTAGILAAILLPCLSAEEPAQDMVVSGFSPFGGRKENASLVLARAMAAQKPGLTCREIPVVWGAPARELEAMKPFPRLWLAIGEGTPVFQWETVADNDKALPPRPEIEENGPDRLLQPLGLEGIARSLTEAGFPTRLSDEAGGYLCEEMLYELLQKAGREEAAGRPRPVVLFLHVPPLGATVQGRAGQPEETVDAAYLERFAKVLCEEIGTLRKEIPKEPAPASP
jgi:pyroglutamyl-peptidase